MPGRSTKGAMSCCHEQLSLSTKETLVASGDMSSARRRYHVLS